MKNGWYAFGLLLAACAGAVAKPAIIAPASAAQVQRWDYHCTKGNKGFTETAKSLGAQGWELATASGSRGWFVHCYKRPM